MSEHNPVDQAIREISRVLLGKPEQVRLALCCLLCGGHLLLEDLPGMGKTTLSQALAKVMGLAFKRVQFTADLMPSDIVGVSVYRQDRGQFEFIQGPVFTEVLLADEINRATPRTQSALLEAMAEGQVSVEGQTRSLPVPFFVIATQNPSEHTGTYPLPESQLDRFLMRLSMGYPHPDAERELLMNAGNAPSVSALQRCFNKAQLATLRDKIAGIHAADSVLDYLQRLVGQSRQSPAVAVGLSPRGALALLGAAKAWAFMEHRGHVVPEDIQAVFPAVAGHRLLVAGEGDGKAMAAKLLAEVDVIAA
ncbi:MAG: AAA family ATPase [Gammaproteobacteria bacterium]|nr:MAG: AAA family ATPase [Gammaproteobacteria bacterium]